MNRRTDPIPFHRPSIGRAERRAVDRVLRSRWLTTGRETLRFEEEFAEFIRCPNALAVNSATAGLHLALEALGVGEGDQVITTPYTFTATAEAIRHLGAHPRFVDINPDDFQIDPSGVEALLEKEKTACLLPVHLGGAPCAATHLKSLAERRHIPLIEDAAHAFPLRIEEGETSEESRKAAPFAGTVGDAGVFSFYATKPLTTGEGGMVVTNSKKTAERIQIMRLHGIDRDAWFRYEGNEADWEYYVVEAGYKYNMPDTASAMGRVQLKRAWELAQQRKRIAKIYLSRLGEYSFFEMPPAPSSHAWHLFLLRIRPEQLTITRDEYIRALSEAGIGTSVHYIPLHLMPYYRDRYGLKPGDFPNALDSFSRTISLPLYPELTDRQIDRIIETVIHIGKSHFRLS
ncbi:MAG: DegT/DnrJ/EryC1/StrS family aminotransferase [Spirochaetales bacterium]|nr:DegT/DnrJ/EryC1/StrS family aminotransferase [Spirochaetales bacterium]MCF7937081.1 DegT/DnrJ/EryC1/StrS family aminotransferase [Spirochaetales bacterium]